MLSATIRESVEQMAVFSTAILRVARYEWNSPIDESWANDHGALHLILSPRPPSTRARCEGGARTSFEPLGDITFFPPDLVFRARGDVGSQRSFQCQLPLDAVEKDLVWEDRQLRECLNVRAPSVQQNFRRVAAEFFHPGFAAPLLIESLCHVVTLDIIRHFAGLQKPLSGSGGLTPWQLKRIEDRVVCDGPTPSIGELATSCGVGRRHLMRAFKQSQQETIFTYVARARMERAKQMLVSRHSVAEIGLQLGFANPTSFSSAFKRAVGMTPRSFRDAFGARS